MGNFAENLWYNSPKWLIAVFMGVLGFIIGKIQQSFWLFLIVISLLISLFVIIVLYMQTSEELKKANKPLKK